MESAQEKYINMPIYYKILKKENLIKVKFIGKITDKEMIDAYSDLFQHKDWSSDLNELTDLSDLNGVDISFEGLEQLAEFIGGTLNERGAAPKVAIYAPTDLAFGLARVYTVNSEDFEVSRVFRNIEDAKKWLSEK